MSFRQLSFFSKCKKCPSFPFAFHHYRCISGSKSNSQAVDAALNPSSGTSELPSLQTSSLYASSLGTSDSPEALSSIPLLSSMAPLVYHPNIIDPHNVTSNALFTILACFKAGQIYKAERMFYTLHQRTPSQQLAQLANIHFHNNIIHTFISQQPLPLMNHALGWFKKLASFGVQPNTSTFALLLKGYLCDPQSDNLILNLLGEMTLHNIHLSDIIQLDLLEKNHIQKIDLLMKQKRDTESTLDVNELLSDLGFDEASSKIQPSPSPQSSFDLHSIKTVGVDLVKKSLATENQRDLPLFTRQLKMEQQSYVVAMEKLYIQADAMNQSPSIHNLVLRKMISEWLKELESSLAHELEEMSKHPTSANLAFVPLLSLLTPKQLASITVTEILRMQNSHLPHREGSEKEEISQPWEYNDEDPLQQALEKPADPLEGLDPSSVVDFGVVPHLSMPIRFTSSALAVSSAVERQYNANQWTKKSNKQILSKLFFTQKTMYESPRNFSMALRRVHAEIQAQTEECIKTDWLPIWPVELKLKAGSFLISEFIKVAKVKENVNNDKLESSKEISAFFHTYYRLRGNRIGVIQAHPKVTEALMKAPVKELLHPSFLPMIVQPRPWITWKSGGYLSSYNEAVRTHSSREQRIYLEEAFRRKQLETVLTGIDILGLTKWRINEEVLRIALQAWNTGEAIGDLPSSKLQEIAIPNKPFDYDDNPKSKRDYLRAKHKIVNQLQNQHSLRCDANYKLEIARGLVGQTLYFPHNFDFRGRAYPIPPNFNHLGSDFCRGLLKFQEAKPVGQNGLKWLKIHLANLAGQDKVSFDERVKFTMANLDNIFDSADQPLKGRRWWLQAEAPWQCLATCFELSRILRSKSPEKELSFIPVHQDGSCNGLQHYAALGGDIAGAEQVNLKPAAKPGDVYTGVSEVVKKLVEEDASKGLEEAIIALPFINRKLVKQTVMTDAYGVTYIGARQQISRRLKEADPLMADDVQFKLASYLAIKVFASLKHIFSGARALQSWLDQCSKLITNSVSPDDFAMLLESKENKSKKKNLRPTKEIGMTSLEHAKQKLDEMTYLLKKSKKLDSTKEEEKLTPATMNRFFKSPVVWTTPLGLPVVQPYRRNDAKEVTTSMQSCILRLPSEDQPVHRSRQQSAFPPNFIHSLDGSHMLMTCISCYKAGLTFASVHDSFWTHASDVDTMNRILREEFVKLHSQPIMQQLKEEFETRYRGYKVLVKEELSKNDKTRLKASQQREPSHLLEEHEEDIAIGDSTLNSKGQAEAGEGDTNEIGHLNKGPAVLYETKKMRISGYDIEFPRLPSKGEFDVQEVLKSLYFFH